MARIDKYLRQYCVIQRAKRTANGEVQLNGFGEVEYTSPIQVKCRREKSVKDVYTSNGSIVKSTTRYFFNPNVDLNIDDKIDDKLVQTVSEYVSGSGKVEGIECNV